MNLCGATIAPMSPQPRQRRHRPPPQWAAPAAPVRLVFVNRGCYGDSQVVQLDHLKARECVFFHLGSITSTPGHYRNTASNCFEVTIDRIAFFYRFYALQTYSENATYLR